MIWSIRVFIAVSMTLALVSGRVTGAQTDETEVFTGYALTTRVVEIQRDADRAFKRGDYARAFRIYYKGLVWRGDKFAQYQLGRMYLDGLGVTRDRPLALAWMQLAAERGNPGLEAAFDKTVNSLTAAERERAGGHYTELVESFGDRRILVRLIRADRREMLHATGSRVGFVDSLPLSIQLRSGKTVTGQEFYGTIRDRIDTRMGYLEGVVELGELVLIDDDETTDGDVQPSDEDDGEER